MKAKFYASSNPAALAATNPHITVEAEYGDVVVPGSRLTMAHHGPRAGSKCPASYTAADVYDVGDDCAAWLRSVVVGLSHFDLDTLGGCCAVIDAAAYGYKPGSGAFWALAEWVDLNGPHRLDEGRGVAARAALRDLSPKNAAYMDQVLDGEYHATGQYPVDYGMTVEVDAAIAAIHAFWAWSAANRGPRIGADVVDLTDHVLAARQVVCDLFPYTSPSDFPEDDPQAAAAEAQWERRAELLAAGREFMAAEAQLRASSFVRQRGSVVLRRAPAFVNHLYPASPGAAVIAFNETTGAVTVSFADGAASPVSAVEVVQSLWGPLAGGHRGIAGSPRGQAMTFADAEKAFELVAGPEGCDYHGKWAEAECPDCRRTWEW